MLVAVLDLGGHEDCVEEGGGGGGWVAFLAMLGMEKLVTNAARVRAELLFFLF